MRAPVSIVLVVAAALAGGRIWQPSPDASYRTPADHAPLPTSPGATHDRPGDDVYVAGGPEDEVAAEGSQDGGATEHEVAAGAPAPMEPVPAPPEPAAFDPATLPDGAPPPRAAGPATPRRERPRTAPPPPAPAPTTTAAPRRAGGAVTAGGFGSPRFTNDGRSDCDTLRFSVQNTTAAAVVVRRVELVFRHERYAGRWERTRIGDHRASVALDLRVEPDASRPASAYVCIGSTAYEAGDTPQRYVVQPAATRLVWS